MSDDTTDDTLGAIILRAVREADEMRKSGSPPELVAKALDAVVREHWPKGRVDDWHQLCEVCNDTGWEIWSCPGDVTCGRTKRHASHTYAVLCTCLKGQRLRMPTPSQAVDDAAASDYQSPKRKMNRWGRS